MPLEGIGREERLRVSAKGRVPVCSASEGRTACRGSHSAFSESANVAEINLNE